MTVHQYDIVLDVTVINRTAETMQVGGCACVCVLRKGGGEAVGAVVLLSAGAPHPVSGEWVVGGGAIGGGRGH